MAILTKFLQLLKPEKNDYVDVEKHLSENYDKIDAELEKKASATQLGRIKIGTNLKIDPDGTLHGNPGYTHPSGNGNNHIPANGASGNFLKYLSAGVAQWAKITKKDIDDFPSFGTEANEMLEGVKLAETLGIPYGGILNNSNTKTEGTAYYDSTTKKTYKCTVTNTLNYADASKYEAISNNDLLLKFQNYKIETKILYSNSEGINDGEIVLSDNIDNYNFLVFETKSSSNNFSQRSLFFIDDALLTDDTVKATSNSVYKYTIASTTSSGYHCVFRTNKRNISVDGGYQVLKSIIGVKI